MRKVALVTGGGKRRIGWHVVQSLADRGYALAVHYHTSAAEAAETVADLEARGIEALAVGGDLARESDVRQMVAASLDRFGRLDVLVNTAAIWEAKPLELVTADDVRRHFDTNALGTFLCCQQVGLAMVAQAEGGAIVNFGDWAEARPYLNYAAYFLSKGAVTAMTRSLAVELAARNPWVRVNCILPGPAMLPQDLPDAQRQAVIDGTLVKREGSPKNIALAVLHFIDNDFVTGVCLPVDGGRTIYAAGEAW
jgi:pteridine reductase